MVGALDECHDFCRRRCLSLFGRRSAVDVTGLLAIIDPFFIFHWFCLVFPHTCFQSHSLPVVYLTLCFPSCLWQRLFYCQCCDFVVLVRDGSSYPWFVSPFSVMEHVLLTFIKSLHLHSILTLLRLTSLPPIHTTLTRPQQYGSNREESQAAITERVVRGTYVGINRRFSNVPNLTWT